ncbi:MAG: hypothetical protein QQN45_06940 [Nitrosopumilus sp.]
MSKNGEIIQEYLEYSQYEMELEIEKCSHKYFQNGTISCIMCDNIRRD